MGHNSGKLTTHVLDTARGKPADGMSIRLYQIQSPSRTLLLETATNHDGRCSAPLLEGATLKKGTYELLFLVKPYFHGFTGVAAEPFLDEVPIRFTVGDDKVHYHIPLLVSPWSYSTYRGS